MPKYNWKSYSRKTISVLSAVALIVIPIVYAVLFFHQIAVVFIILLLVMVVMMSASEPSCITHSRITHPTEASIQRKTIWFINDLLFPILLTFYLILLLVQKVTFLPTIWIDVATILLSGHVFLIALIACSVVVGFTSEDEKKQRENLVISNTKTLMMLVLVVVLSTLGTWIIWSQISTLDGGLRFVISVVSGVLIFLIGILVLEDEDEDASEPTQTDLA